MISQEVSRAVKSAFLLLETVTQRGWEVSWVPQNQSMHPTQPPSICFDFTSDFSAWYSLTCPDSWLSQTCRSLVLNVYPEAASDPFRRGIIRQRSVGWEWAVATSYPSKLACDSNQKPSWLCCLFFLGFLRQGLAT